MVTATPSFAQWLEALRPRIDSALAESLATTSAQRAPGLLQEAIADALLSGGKRVRPGLCLLACEAEGGSTEAALPAAVACELIHAYSLVHDDLPCMDDDALRRGRPTVHVRFGEATAVLVGDALQALAFECLAAQDDGARARDQALLLARAAGPAGMVGGQQLDLAAEGDEPDAGQVEAIHRAKTGALLEVAMRLGARAAGADPAAWTDYGATLGQLFQVTDDLLDATASTAELGKTAGKDAEAAKATVVAALGLEGARLQAQELADRARAALAARPDWRCRDALDDLPTYLLQRCR